METKKTYAPHELQPSTPIHPGEILKDELESRGMSQRKFAAVIGVSYSVLNEVINGKRPITTEYALKIEAATGIESRDTVLGYIQRGGNFFIKGHLR